MRSTDSLRIFLLILLDIGRLESAFELEVYLDSGERLVESVALTEPVSELQRRLASIIFASLPVSPADRDHTKLPIEFAGMVLESTMTWEQTGATTVS